jgi:hypothetical protein
VIKMTLEFATADEAIAFLQPRQPSAPVTKAPAPKATATPAATPTASPTASPASSQKPAGEAPKADGAKVEYKDLQQAVMKLAGKSRDEAAALVATFNVKTFKELPEDKWAEALAAVNAKLAELGA